MTGRFFILLVIICSVGMITFCTSPAYSAKEEATFYEHDNYKGNKFTLSRGKHDSKLSKKQCGQVYERKNWNDRISSIKIGYCTKVVMYEHADYKGQQLVYENPFKDTEEKINLPRGWNDKVSSIKTYATSTCKRSKCYVVTPDATGKILQITNVERVKGSTTSYKVTIQNRTDYFYGVKILSSKTLNKILGRKEKCAPVVTPGKTPNPNIPGHIYVKARFNLGVYYLQAGYSIAFGEEPPKEGLDKVLDLIVQKMIEEKTGVPGDLYLLKPQTIAEQFVSMAAKPKWAKKLAEIAGKKGSEKMIMSKAGNILSVIAVKNRAKALKYYVQSLRAPEYEQLEVEFYKN